MTTVSMTSESMTVSDAPVQTHIAVGSDCNIIVGDSRKALQGLPENYFQCCVTSPPYWGLRDYGIEGQIGAEPTVEKYIQSLVKVFRQVRRTLRNDGTLCLNIGDSYTSGNPTCRHPASNNPTLPIPYQP